VKLVQINEIASPYRNALDVLDQVNANPGQQTGVYDAIIADGKVTKSNRRYSRKDFVNAKNKYFSKEPQPYEKSKDILQIGIADEFFPDGTMRLNRLIGQVLDLRVIDTADTWVVQIRFAVMNLSERSNPWYQTMQPLLTRLHGYYKAIPTGLCLEPQKEDGVEIVNNFDLRYVILSTNSNFQMADAVKPVFQEGRRDPSEFQRPNRVTQVAARENPIFGRRRF